MTSQAHKDGSLGLATQETTIANELPSVSSMLSKLENPTSLACSGEAEGLPAKGDGEEEEDRLFHALKEVLLKTESGEEETAFDVRELRDALETAGILSEQERDPSQLVGGATSILQKLWQSKSRYMVDAAEALANASRDRETSAISKLVYYSR
jgi:hypothetical protein